MPWVRFADDYLSNPKVLRLGPLPRLLDVSAIIYSARELRDGHLSHADVVAVAAQVGIVRWVRSAAELVEVGRWHACPDGAYDIHDYLEYQPSRDEVLAKRAVRAAAGAAGGRAKALANGLANSQQTPSKSPTPYPVPANPVPDPDPEPPRAPPDEQGGRLPRRGRRRRSEAEPDLEPTPTRPEDAMQLGCAEHADHWTASCDSCVSRRDASIEASRDVLEAVMNGAAR